MTNVTVATAMSVGRVVGGPGARKDKGVSFAKVMGHAPVKGEASGPEAAKKASAKQEDGVTPDGNRAVAVVSAQGVMAMPVSVAAPAVALPEMQVADGDAVRETVDLKVQKGPSKKDATAAVTLGDAAPTVAATGNSPLPVVEAVAPGHVKVELQTSVVAFAPAVHGLQPTGVERARPSAPVAVAPVVAAHPAEETKTFVATAKVLEIGVADGTHGWLRVRAEVGRDGEVQASFTAASAGAAEQLHKELPGMQAYLASEQVGVQSIVVHAAERSAGAYDAAAHPGGAGTGQSGEAPRREGAGDWRDGLNVADAGGDFDFDPAMLKLPAAIYAGFSGSGGWLSVRV